MASSTVPILIVDAPARSADLCYASGFWAPDPLVCLQTPHGMHLVVSLLEQGRALQLAEMEPWRKLKVWTPDLLNLRGAKRRSLGEWAAALLKEVGVRQVRVPGSFPLGTARRLVARGVRLRVATDALYPSRVCKQEAELERMADCQRAAVAGMRAAVARIRGAAIGPGGALREGRRRLTAEEIRLTIQETLLRHGTLCRDVIVAPGAQGADPHERGHGPLQAGAPIVIDIFPEHMTHGYWGDLTRTVVRGRASREVRRLYAAVKAAHRAALDVTRAGVAVQRVHAAAADTFTRLGYKNETLEGKPQGFIHSTGHGVGLEIHEAPSLGPVAGRLRTGAVVTIEPGLYYTRLGGVRIEDTVVVERDGCRLLAACPYPFEV